MQSQRGGGASTAHRLEGRSGDHSFRSNLDLFNQEKQRQLSSTSMTLEKKGVSHVPGEQHDDNGASADDDKQGKE